jgi:hypothetical protein
MLYNRTLECKLHNRRTKAWHVCPASCTAAGFNFTLPPVNFEVPWFSLSLPNLDLDIDASAPIEAAAVIIDTAAGWC